MTQGDAAPGQLAVVLDTNLFVAAFWNRRSASADILRACLERRVRLFYTRQIRSELYLILRNIRAPDYYRRQVEDILEQGTELLSAGGLSVVSEDPDDDKFLECARLARADYLVTSDGHLLRLKRFDGTGIVKPSEFRRILSAFREAP
ncbi:MAG TPA: putative toxin-antitoxin system toxin component, PIN family [Armatimonadota bacterium]|nr:putative toxin-antitoxin system toxin component, PIN family [Armatimonadota bacterium]